MPSFSPGPNMTTAFGVNEYHRSTANMQFESYTFAQSGLPDITIDGHVQKVLQPGTILAKITSGPDAGKVGAFQAGVTDGREDVLNIVGVCDTFLPYQLMDRDVEVASLYHGTCVQAWCIEYDAAGDPIALTAATADACRETLGTDVTFK